MGQKAKKLPKWVTPSMLTSDGRLDGRKVPLKKRNPKKYKTGQHAPSKLTKADQLPKDAILVFNVLAKECEPMTVRRLAAFCFTRDSGKVPSGRSRNLIRIRNALRPIVAAGWAKRVDFATYQVTEKGLTQ